MDSDDSTSLSVVGQSCSPGPPVQRLSQSRARPSLGGGGGGGIRWQRPSVDRAQEDLQDDAGELFVVGVSPESSVALPRPDRSPEDSLNLGVSIAYLQTEFLDEVEGHFGADADPDYGTLNPVMLFGPDARGAAFRCPRDGLPGCSYADALDSDHTGTATVMLSWCWRYSVRTVVDALTQWCERSGRDPAKTFVWQCALCCNQFRVEEKKARGESEPFESFVEMFESRVCTTMHVVALLAPWDDPVYVSRIWCIFEVWKAMTTEGCEFEVVLPVAEQLRFRDALGQDGLLAMWKAFEKLRIQDAQATVEADRVNILRLVDPDAETQEDYEASELCANVNREVIAQLQRWCVTTAAAYAQDKICAGRSLGHTGLFTANLLMAAADWEGAEAILEAAKGALESAGAEGSLGHMALLRHMADLRNRQGLHEEAAELIGQVTEAMAPCIEREPSGPLSSGWIRRREFAAALRTAAETENLRGRLAAAVPLFERAKSVFDYAGASGTLEYTSLLAELGDCLCRQGRDAEAEELLSDAAEVLDDGHVTPEDGEVLKVLGRCRLLQGRLEEASDLLIRSRRIFEDTGSSRSASYAELLVLLGTASLEGGAPEEASELFDWAQGVMEVIGAVSRAEFLQLPMHFGRVSLAQGQPEEAMELFAQAREAMEGGGLGETPEFAWLLLATGKCHLAAGNAADASALVEQSRALFAAAGASNAFARLVLASV